MIKASMMRTTAPCLLVATAFAASSQAQGVLDESNTAKVIPGQVVIGEATHVVEQAKHDPGMESLIHRAKAIFIVPQYGEASYVGDKAEDLNVTGNVIPATADLTRHGSPGAFLVRGLGAWSSPTFYTIAWGNYSNESRDTYARGAPIVMVFMTDQGAHPMRSSPTGTCSLSGLKVTPYSNDPGVSFADADVVVWTPDHMPSAGPLPSEQISFRDLATSAFYNNQATLWQILSNNVGTDRALGLQTVLLTRVASSRRSTATVE